MKKILDEAERALTEVVFSLTPYLHEPGEDIEKELITFDREETGNGKWKALLTEYLKTAKTLEIHCWNEETEWIELALQYGYLKESDWQHGKNHSRKHYAGVCFHAVRSSEAYRHRDIQQNDTVFQCVP